MFDLANEKSKISLEIYMRITVKVKPGAKKPKIERLSGDNFSIWVREKPRDGKANHAVREALSDHLGIPKSRVVLISGEKSKIKVFEIQ